MIRKFIFTIFIITLTLVSFLTFSFNHVSAENINARHNVYKLTYAQKRVSRDYSFTYDEIYGIVSDDEDTPYVFTPVNSDVIDTDFYVRFDNEDDGYLYITFISYGDDTELDYLTYNVYQNTFSMVILDSFNNDNFTNSLITDGFMFSSQSPTYSYNTDDDFLLNTFLYFFTSYTIDFNYIYQNGYDEGYEDGYNQGYEDGQDGEGPLFTYDDGFADGEQYVQDNPRLYNLYTQSEYNTYGAEEYQRGRRVGLSEGATLEQYTFEDLITSVIDTPIKAIFGTNANEGLLNFELLGVNLANFFMALFTIALCITIIKLLI